MPRVSTLPYWLGVITHYYKVTTILTLFDVRASCSTYATTRYLFRGHVADLVLYRDSMRELPILLIRIAS